MQTQTLLSGPAFAVQKCECDFCLLNLYFTESETVQCQHDKSKTVNLAHNLAKDEDPAEFGEGKSSVPLPRTALPGRNFKLLGFGVS